MLGSSCRNADVLQVDPERACKVHKREKKKGVERKPVMRSDRYVKGKRSEGPGSQER